MKKRFSGVIALVMSAIMSVSAMAAGSVAGTAVTSSTAGDGYVISFEATDVSSYLSGATFADGKSADDYKAASEGDAGKIVVKNTVGDIVEFTSAADVVISFPDITDGVKYAILAGDKASGYQMFELGTASVSTSSNGAVLADMTAPTLSGQDVTIHYNDLTDAIAALYIVKDTTSTTGDVNPVIPVLAGVVVVSAAVLMFRKKRA